MSRFGITAEGFKKKTLDDLRKQFEEDLKSEDMFGDNIDFSDQDPLYHFSMPILYIASELWEVAEHAFYSASPKFAEYNNLSNTGKYIGIARKQAVKSIGEVTFTGDEGVAIVKGFRIATEDGIVFETLEEVTIPKEKTITVRIKAIDPGIQGNVPGGTINTIVNPIIGLDSVTNKKETIKGQDRETDVEFRERYDKSVAQRATNIYDSIRAHVLKVTNVKDAIVKENDTMDIVDGIPQKSFHTIVLGGLDKEVAKAIFEKKPGGIQAYGTRFLDVMDSKGEKHKIGFSRPVAKNIWIKIKITKNTQFPKEGSNTIRDIVKDYIDKFKMGQDVILYKIISNIDKANIDGIEDMDISVSIDGKEYKTNNIEINDLEVAITELDKIEVI
ncbi:hypothetical protein FDF74_12655 [Clostridium niameyense]|uniref:Baseplate protein J-like barrel domain-containing protein n=1 Tax=Clostridium niameyense TaxID=1622073 RepID=A0A6M0RCI8_9CLOT|nr:baseplate J/gp47 family protein [Clostridium niameyense]NEZ48021.1 hypothetical protein [Clostridium niameyense]